MKVRLHNPDREVQVAEGRLVHRVLDELGISADAVLVIRDGESRHPRDQGPGRGRARDPARDLGRRSMRCRTCRATAVIEIRRHHAAFCRQHVLAMVRRQEISP